MRPWSSLAFLLCLSLPGYGQEAAWHSLGFPIQFRGDPVSLSVTSDGRLYSGIEYQNLPAGLIASSDGGDSWQSLPWPGDPANYGSEPMFLASNSKGYVFAGSYDELFRSTDDGATWTNISPPNVQYGPLSLLVARDDAVFAKFREGMYFSSNGGDTWTLRGAGLGPDVSGVPGGRMAVSRAPGSSGHVFFFRGGNITLYKTTNDGVKWSPLFAVPPSFDDREARDVIVADDGTIFLMTRRIYRSSDNGASWDTVYQQEDLPKSLVDLGSGHLLFLGDAGWQSGIYSSTDHGTSWGRLSILQGTDQRSLIRAGDGTLYASTWKGGYFRSRDEGRSWVQINRGIPYSASEVTLLAKGSSGTILAGTSNSGAFRSAADRVWTSLLVGPYYLSENYGVTSLGAGADNTYWATTKGGGGATWQSTDEGLSWSRRSYNAGVSLFVGRDGTVYVGGASYFDRHTPDGGFRTTIIGARVGNAGYSIHVSLAGTILTYGVSIVPPRYPRPGRTEYWTMIIPDLNGTRWYEVPIGDIQNPVRGYTSTRDNRLFAATGTGVYASSDTGHTWTLSNTGIPTIDIRCITVDDSDVLYAGTWSAGVYRSSDYGITWTPFNAGVGDVQITSLFYATGGSLLAGGWNNGIYETSVPTSVGGVQTELPQETRLLQNYPNPFNSRTGIRYQVTGVTVVKITVHDLLGREVVVLVNERKAPGRYEVSFDGSGLASGLYLYRLQAGSLVETRKMLLIR